MPIQGGGNIPLLSLGELKLEFKTYKDLLTRLLMKHHHKEYTESSCRHRQGIHKKSRRFLQEDN